MQSHEALPYLKEFIQDKDKELAEQAIVALSSTGSDAIPLLTEVFQTNTDSDIRAAAAKGLGEIGSHTGDPSYYPTSPGLSQRKFKTYENILQTLISLFLLKWYGV